MRAISLPIRTEEQVTDQESTLRWVFAFAVLVASLSALPVVAQQPSEDDGPGARRSDSISGRVVNENGQPIASATVFVQTLGSRDGARVAVTDSEGNFRLDGLAARAYMLSASISPYAPAVRYSGSDQIQYYRVGDSVRVELKKGAVLTGTVTTSEGEPVVAVLVRASLIRDGNGRPPRYGAQLRAQVTDDRGIYRIYGLPAGTYVVAAGGGADLPYGNSNAYESDTPTFAPSSARNTAREISVGAGEEISGVDIRYRGERGVRVSGTATSTSPTELSGYRITLNSIGIGTPEYHSFAKDRFVFDGVADGDYLISAQSNFGGEPTVSESRQIKVRGADVTDIELTTKPLGSITGRVALEGSKVPECKGKRRPVLGETVITPWHDDKESNSQPPFLWAIGGPSTPNEDGAFTLRYLAPARYRLNPTFFAKYWYLRSITLPNSRPSQGKAPSPNALFDAAQNWIEVKLGDRVSELIVTLAEGAASLQGKVSIPDDQKREQRFSVFLVPAEAASAKDVTRFFVAQSTNGAFTFNNLPPGRYWVAARPVEESETQSQLRLPDQADTRARLRREIEASKIELELKPCQNLMNYSLPVLP
jgi:hypothetical protein